MSEVFNRSTALAVCFANLKGSRDKDLLRTAHALKYLKGLPDVKSNERVAEQVGVSAEIVRQFIALLDLPPSIQGRIDQKTLGLEQGRRLWQLQRSRPDIVEDAAEAMVSMTAMEARDFVEFLRRNSTASVETAVSTLEDAKAVTTREHLICALVSESEYQVLAEHCKKRRITVNDLITAITLEWLGRNDD